MSHPALCVHHYWWHSPDPPNEITSSLINPGAGLSSHLGPVGPACGPVTSPGWSRRSRWQASQVKGSGDPRRPTSRKGWPLKLSTAPHGGWSRAPHCPSYLWTSLTFGFPAPFWRYTVNWYTVSVTILGMSWKPGYKLETSATTITWGRQWVVETCFVVVLFNVQAGLSVLLTGERKERHRGGDTHWVKVRNRSVITCLSFHEGCWVCSL